MTTWATCDAYLRAHCDAGAGPMPEPTMRYAHLLWVLSEAIAAESILEIGIGPTSVSGCTFIHSMGSRGGGALHSIDVEPDRPRQLYKDLAIQQNVRWTQTYGDSLEGANQLDPDLRVDLLYVDGAHDFEHAYGDTVTYLPFLRRGGYLIIDDYPGFAGVAEAAKKLKDAGYSFLHVAHEPPHGNGRLVWQKPLWF